MATWNQLIEDRMGDFTISSDASSIADANGVDQFLSDGILDIIERCRKYKPELMPLFAYESSTGSTNNRELKNMDLLRVVAQFSSVKYPARYVTPDIFLKAGISGSIYEATNSDPIYTVRKKTVFVLPSGGEDYVFDVILPDPSVDASSATGNTNPSNFPEDMHHLLATYGSIKVLEHILSGQAHASEDAVVLANTNIGTALGKVNELFSTDGSQPDILDIQDALTKAQNLIDGSDMGDDSNTAESVQFWLLDEDTDMVSSTLSVASQELSRAGQIMSAIDKKTAALSKYTEAATNYLQVAAGYSATISLLEKIISSLKVDYISYFSPAQIAGGGKNEA